MEKWVVFFLNGCMCLLVKRKSYLCMSLGIILMSMSAVNNYYCCPQIRVQSTSSVHYVAAIQDLRALNSYYFLSDGFDSSSKNFGMTLRML